MPKNNPILTLIEIHTPAYKQGKNKKLYYLVRWFRKKKGLHVSKIDIRRFDGTTIGVWISLLTQCIGCG